MLTTTTSTTTTGSLGAGQLPSPGRLPSPDDIEQELIRLESLVARIRSRQLELLADIDRLQVPYWDGTRSLKEWITGRLDVHPRTAGDRAVLAKAEPGPISQALGAGVASFDRAAATTRLYNSGADEATLERSEGVAVSQIGRLAARTRRMSPLDEIEAFRARRIWMQPNLTNTLSRGTFAMPGVDADLFLAGLDQRADAIIDRNDPHRPRLEQRRLDALVSLATDVVAGPGAATATTGTDETKPAPGPRRTRAHIFIDAARAARTNGETGAITRHGLEVGRNTLEEILCIGDTQTTLIDATGLKAVPTNGDRLPNRTRDFVFYRDGGCTADGCTSRYRLEPHHIKHRGRSGDHDVRNLTLLCWFHHHVVVHQLGFQIDPASPPGRRRFRVPDIGADPPGD